MEIKKIECATWPRWTVQGKIVASVALRRPRWVDEPRWVAWDPLGSHGQVDPNGRATGTVYYSRADAEAAVQKRLNEWTKTKKGEL